MNPGTRRSVIAGKLVFELSTDMCQKHVCRRNNMNCPFRQCRLTTRLYQKLVKRFDVQQHISICLDQECVVSLDKTPSESSRAKIRHLLHDRFGDMNYMTFVAAENSRP